MLETVNCNICGNSRYDIIFQADLMNRANIKEYSYASGSKAGQIVRCIECGLVYVNPRDKNIENLYEKVIDEFYLKSKNERVETFIKDLRRLEKIFRKKGKLLDVGCGPGLFLKAAKESGWDVKGVELSKWACDYARKQGLIVYNKELDNCKIIKEEFDVITLWDVIEHVTDPSGLLKEGNRILKKDGILVIDTPNVDSFFAKLRGRKWGDFIRMHIYYFSPKTIRLLLEKNGFKIIKMENHSRVIVLRNAVEWLNNRFSHFIFKKTFLGNIKLRVNLGDDMLVYARKDGR